MRQCEGQSGVPLQQRDTFWIICKERNISQKVTKLRTRPCRPQIEAGEEEDVKEEEEEGLDVSFFASGPGSH